MEMEVVEVIMFSTSVSGGSVDTIAFDDSRGFGCRVNIVLMLCFVVVVNHL